MAAARSFTLVTPQRTRHDGPPGAGARLAARLLSARLDAQLAAGARPWQSGVLTARALQLTSKRHRWATARALDRLLEVVDEPITRLSSVVPVCREQVWAATDLLLGAAMRLRRPGPVDPRGVAMLSCLLSDGTGPCYVRSHLAALACAVEDAISWLEAED